MTADPGWDPNQYARFSGPRLRPAIELLARIDHPGPRHIHDLGTGRGEMARAMAERWPGADVVGSDLSRDMLDAAATIPSRVRWETADIRTWVPDEPVDVLFSNAALHWVDHHDEVFRRLVAALAPGGVLAVQMPLSWTEPSHQAMRDTLAHGGPGGRSLGDEDLRARYERRPVHDASWYYDLLDPLVADLDIWETRYLQVLEGADAVFEWVKGTALRPILEALAGDDLDRFVVHYKAALNTAYPQQPNGTTLYPFPRLFIVARTYQVLSTKY